ncbi:LysR family transcriptional regulator [Paracoccus suum]|uniref:LysR family transcriptional regulator n=1 Tax=Paracoccus suum TaxID=2259340 RepID=A0A344PN04_9RHOB|nr:LysR family transcriptional regulator [Paracoccus suum]AXC50759.1 LysR family transcriptional regulator [Paracoccus suum]
MRLNARLVECFNAVMTVGTVTAAATMLNTSQPAVSRSIKQLESATGLKLFQREKGRLIPTAHALAFFEEVKKSFSGLDQLGRVAASLRGHQSGSVSIVCAPVFSYGFVADAASRFLDKYEAVSLSVDTQSSPTIGEWMAAQRFDIAVARYHSPPGSVIATPFSEPEEVCVLPPYHPLAARKLLTAKDLQGSRFVFLGNKDPYRFRLDTVFDRAGIDRDLVVETPHSASACSMVLKGAGIAIVNPFTAVDFLPHGLIMRRFANSLPFTTTLLRARHRPASPLVDLFIKELYLTRDRYLEIAARALE